MQDLLSMQRCNLLCLPENYQLKVRKERWHPVDFVSKPWSSIFFLSFSTSTPSTLALYTHKKN